MALKEHSFDVFSARNMMKAALNEYCMKGVFGKFCLNGIATY